MTERRHTSAARTQPPTAPPATHRFVFLTLHNYSLIALSSAVEALRMANRVAGHGGVRVGHCQPGRQAHTGQQRPDPGAHGGYRRHRRSPHCVCVRRRRAWNSAVHRRTHRPRCGGWPSAHVPLGSLCTGGYALAKAGLLDKYKAVVHWENMSALEEQFPAVHFSEQLYAIDRDRYTCSGGIAPLDLMLEHHQGPPGT